MLSVSIKCDKVCPVMISSMLSDISKSCLEGSPSSTIGHMMHIVDSIFVYQIREEAICPISRSIIYHEDLPIPCSNNPLNHWKDTSGFVVGSDEEYDIIWRHFGGRSHARVESLLHGCFRSCEAIREQNKTKKWYSHIREHRLISGVQISAQANSMILEKKWTREVLILRRETRESVEHWSAHDEQYRVLRGIWSVLRWWRISGGDSWEKLRLSKKSKDGIYFLSFR